MCRTGSLLNELHRSVDRVDFVPEGEDTALMIFEFKNSALGELTVSYSTRLEGWEMFWPNGWNQRIQLYGSDGSVYLELPSNKLSISSEREKMQEMKGRITIPVGGDYGASFDGEVEHFVRSLMEGGGFRKGVRGEDAVEDLKVVEAAYQSSREFGAVRIA